MLTLLILICLLKMPSILVVTFTYQTINTFLLAVFSYSIKSWVAVFLEIISDTLDNSSKHIFLIQLCF